MDFESGSPLFSYQLSVISYQSGFLITVHCSLFTEKEPQGLEVRLRGKAAKLEVGIDRDFPVNSLQTNILNRYFSRDAITTLLAFCAAVIGAILPQLFTSKNS